ncbi:succinoglycan biosynthesis protein ExoM [Devosia lucknowensis]|uniref:Succinoglycan biosynthesis protein ExoM n=1 Tax=Devosia lucknowensis TaxID=1096929 RepID=A0A1Y6FT17_9HYPH|nr:glycosyltransferase [Devosia lucknowensis]SMQ76022.1 succinoglycan biosynthesis protein ExoM [Devosia lucknowensis]
MASIDICICTFRRPFLTETLRSVARLDAGGHDVRVIVADNDETPSARKRVQGMLDEMPFATTYLHAPAANICIARNACLDAASGDFLAFIDDDETVSEGWLLALLDKARSEKASAVLGPVRAIYPPEAPDWMTEGDFHSTLPVYVNGTIRTGYTCNVLMRWHAPLRGLRFDTRLGRSGGEDTDFFYRLRAMGGTIAYAPDAVVAEPVTAQRATMAWLVQRRLRFGQTHGMLMSGSRFRAMPKVAAKIAYCGAMTGLTVLSPVARRRNWLRAMLHIGVASSLLGHRTAEHYGQPTAS